MHNKKKQKKAKNKKNKKKNKKLTNRDHDAHDKRGAIFRDFDYRFRVEINRVNYISRFNHTISIYALYFH
jgi:hypothetical protein